MGQSTDHLSLQHTTLINTQKPQSSRVNHSIVLVPKANVPWEFCNEADHFLCNKFHNILKNKRYTFVNPWQKVSWKGLKNWQIWHVFPSLPPLLSLQLKHDVSWTPGLFQKGLSMRTSVLPLFGRRPVRWDAYGRAVGETEMRKQQSTECLPWRPPGRDSSMFIIQNSFLLQL